MRSVVARTWALFTSKSILDSSCLVYDSAAGASLIKDKRLLSSYRAQLIPDAIRGVGDHEGGIDVKGFGRLRPPFNKLSEVAYCPDAIANIIADADLKEYFDIVRVYNDNHDSVVLVDKDTREQIEFKCNGENMFVCDMDSVNPTTGPKRVFTTYYQALGLSKSSIKAMFKVGRLHRGTGYRVKSQLLKLVSNNTLMELGLTVGDVENYFEFMHLRQCDGCKFGKAKSPDAVMPEHEKVIGLRVAHVCHLDVVHLTSKSLPTGVKAKVRDDSGKTKDDWRIMFLVLIDDFSGYCMAVRIRDRSWETFTAAIALFSAAFKKHGHDTTGSKWEFDHEGSIVPTIRAVAERCPGLTLSAATGGRHSRKAERNLQTLGDSWKAMITGLQYPTPGVLLPLAYLEAVHLSNISFRGQNDVLTPQEIVVGSKPKARHYLDGAFGDLVSFYQKRNGMKKDEKLQQVGILAGRDRMFHDSYKVINLDTGKITVQHKIDPVDMNPLYMRQILSLNDDLTPADLDGTTEEELELQSEIPSTGSENTDCNIILEPDQSQSAPELTPKRPQENVATPKLDQLLREWLSDPAQRVELLRALQLEQEQDTEHFAAEEPPPEVAPPKEQVLEEPPLPEEKRSKPPRNRGRDSRKRKAAAARLPSAQDSQKPVSPVAANTRGRKPREPVEPTKTSSSGRRLKTTGDRRHFVFEYTIKQAIKKFGTGPTMDSVLKELLQMRAQGVWDFIMPHEAGSHGKRPLPTLIFCKEKFDAFNDFEKLKCRLCIAGSMQSLAPHQESSSPTVSLNSVLLVLAIAAKRKMHKFVGDVSGAYLLSDLDEPEQARLSKEVSTILVDNDPELLKFLNSKGELTVSILKAAYGLLQSSNLWFKLCTKVLKDLGYTPTAMDPCVFHKKHKEDWSYITLFVDDLLGCFDDPKEEGRFIAGMCRALGENKLLKSNKCDSEMSYIGMQIVTKPNGDIMVNQKGYLTGLLENYNVVKTAEYPFGGKFMDQTEDNAGEEVSEHDYLSLSMSLLYLASKTRPDILYPNIVLSGRAKTHLRSDYDKLTKILEYLNNTKDLSLVFRSEGDIHLNGCVDASFNQHPDAKGHTGFLISPDLMGSASVMTKSLKQKSVADSTAESELIALHECVQNLLWVVNLAEELGYKQVGVPVRNDNEATIGMAAKEQVMFKGRSKFINRKYFSVHQHVEDGTLKLVFVGTDDNVADFLTKALMGNKFRRFRLDIMGSRGEE